MAELKDYIRLVRAHQFIKNGFVALPLFFAGRLGDGPAFLHTLAAVLLFCLASAAVYIFNDLRDIEEDRAHPVKRRRPLASGAVSRSGALTVLPVLLAGALLPAPFVLGWGFSLILLTYLALNLLYSLWLKHIALVDVYCVALGFVLRVFAGGLAAGVALSHWIVLMTFLLALLLALGKRREELVLAGEGRANRRSLGGYNREFLSAAMVVSAAVTIVTYILYVVSPEVVARYGSADLYLTAFWVTLGIFRHLQLTFVFNRSGSPTMMLLTDRFLGLVVGAWLATFAWAIYG